ncbi:MAG: FadR family transcriptional regulator [Acidobacteria bacterium]|nr:FadR family transcriptional regulator [Acidobacteriota bacterium]
MSSTSLHRRIVHGLGRQILSGKLRPGQPLPIPAGLHASRTAIREAIKVLSAKGLVEARPKVGTRVRTREAWQLLDPDVIGWQQDGPMRADFLRNLTEVRAVLEPAAAEMAARHATDADIAVIDLAYRDMVTATSGARVNFTKFAAADCRFHAAIAAATGNELLQQVGQTIFTALSFSFRMVTAKPGAARASMSRHQAILDAIRRGRPTEARRAMLRLIDHTARQVKKTK